jgi:hypothetical protein
VRDAVAFLGAATTSTSDQRHSIGQSRTRDPHRHVAPRAGRHRGLPRAHREARRSVRPRGARVPRARVSHRTSRLRAPRSVRPPLAGKCPKCSRSARQMTGDSPPARASISAANRGIRIARYRPPPSGRRRLPPRAGYGVRSERRAVLGSLPRRAGGPEPCRDGYCRPGRGTWWCRSGSRSSRSVLDRSSRPGARRPRAGGALSADLRAHPRRRDHRRSELAMGVRREPANRDCGDRRRRARARRSSRSPPG